MIQTRFKGGLKIVRVLSGFTQDELSQKSGVDRARISRIERGYIRPSQREADALGRTLGCSPSVLFEEGAEDAI